MCRPQPLNIAKAYSSFKSLALAVRSVATAVGAVGSAVGSGAGGGPLAANLARAGHKVLLLEAGDGGVPEREEGVLLPVGDDRARAPAGLVEDLEDDTVVVVGEPGGEFRPGRGHEHGRDESHDAYGYQIFDGNCQYASEKHRFHIYLRTIGFSEP